MRLVFAGICVGMSFLCKQYGLATLGMVVLYELMFVNHQSVARWLTRSFVLVSVSMLSITGGLLLSSYYLHGNLEHAIELAGLHGSYGVHSVELLWRALGTLFFGVLPVFLFVALAHTNKGYRSDKHLLYFLCCFCMYLPIFYIDSYPHYFQHLLPFLLGALVAFDRHPLLEVLRPRVYICVAVLLLTLPIVHATRRNVAAVLYGRRGQEVLARELLQRIPEGSPVYINVNWYQSMRFLARLEPPLKEQFGYGFGFDEHYSDAQRQLMIQGAAFLLSPSNQQVQGFVESWKIDSRASLYSRIGS
jgi:hypothetical protein